MESSSMKTRPNSNISPTPKISMAQLRNASPTARLPQLTLWDEIIISTATTRPPHFDIYEWLGDACLNFSGCYFPDLPLRDAKTFAEFFKEKKCHKILAERCYIGNGKQTMSESIVSHFPQIGKKSHSDFLEFYVGILLKSIHIDSRIVWNIIQEIVSVGLLYYLSDSESPKKELDDSVQSSCDNITSTQSNIPSNSESPPSLLRSSITLSAPSQSIEPGQKTIVPSKTLLNQESVSKSADTQSSTNENVESRGSVTSPPSLLRPSISLSAPSQSIESGQKAIVPSKTLLNQESVSKSAYTQSSTNENVESRGSVTSPPIEDLAQASKRPNPSKRRDRHIPRPRSGQIAVAYRRFVFTSIIVDEILALSNDEQDSLYRCRNVLKELIRQLRDDLNKLTIGLSLPGQNPAPLVASKHTLEGQIFEYLTTNALHSEILLEILRDAKPVQEHLDNFRCQLETIIRISRNDGAFKGPETGNCDAWKIIGSDGIECFEGSFPQLHSFLLNPAVDIMQKCGNKNKRKLDTSPSSGGKCSRKNTWSGGQGNKRIRR
jgi:hypothetical protein